MSLKQQELRAGSKRDATNPTCDICRIDALMTKGANVTAAQQHTLTHSQIQTLGLSALVYRTFVSIVCAAAVCLPL